MAAACFLSPPGRRYPYLDFREFPTPTLPALPIGMLREHVNPENILVFLLALPSPIILSPDYRENCRGLSSGSARQVYGDA